jgi:hypothetical protein
MYDDRDVELGVRDRLAEIVALIVSGTPGALPEQDDYNVADHLRAEVERLVNANI